MTSLGRKARSCACVASAARLRLAAKTLPRRMRATYLEFIWGPLIERVTFLWVALARVLVRCRFGRANALQHTGAGVRKYAPGRMRFHRKQLSASSSATLTVVATKRGRGRRLANASTGF